MSDLFSSAWMEEYMTAWNEEAALAGELRRIGFNSTIAYGFLTDEDPKGILIVEQGIVTRAGAYGGEELNWDLRADLLTWQDWMSQPPGMMALGMAYTAGKIKFNAGDYATMIKDPRMAGPFIKSFSVMAKIS